MSSQKNNVEKIKQMLESRFSQKRDIKKYLDKTSVDYRYLDPGRILYEMAMKVSPKKRFSRQYIELVFTTLKTWGMNSRGARLNSFKKFENSIKRNKSILFKLASKNIKELNDNDIKGLQYLYNNMKLTNTKTALVTFSKTMHFFLPNLIAPIDGQYTLTFFKKNNHNSFGDGTKEFHVFSCIEKAYSIFAQKNNLKEYLDKKWNQNIPKIIDNLIIGYMLTHSKK